MATVESNSIKFSLRLKVSNNFFFSGTHTFVVCYYNPPGNYSGEFLNNVYRIGGGIPQGKAEKKLTFEEQILVAHNKYRSLHGCRPLVLDKALMAEASHLAYLKFLEKKNYSKFVFTQCLRKKKQLGENQFHGKNVEHLNADYVVKTWYDKKHAADLSFLESCYQKIPPFGQVIWASNKSLGVGQASKYECLYIIKELKFLKRALGPIY